jgi:glycosyltransferase involved in cell wall biosynthesis
MSTQTESQPLVSVIVPTYNYGHFIGDALQSVRNQTHTNWECIVVDDGSTDDTAEVVARFHAEDARIRYVRQDNARQGAARNNGIRQSRGEYFQFLDADDLIEPEKIETQLRFLHNNKDADVVYSDIRYFDSEDPGHIRRAAILGEEPWMPQISGSSHEFLMRIVRNNIMPINAPLVPRSVIEQVGLFDEDLTPVEDWAFHIRCAATGTRFQFQDQEGVRPLVRTHHESSSSDPRRMLRAEILMRQRIRSVLKDEGVSRLNENRLAEVNGLLGVEEHLHGRRARAVAQFVKAGGMDNRNRFRAKWILCAMVGLFATHEQMRKLVYNSVSDTLGGALRSRLK